MVRLGPGMAVLVKGVGHGSIVRLTAGGALVSVSAEGTAPRLMNLPLSILAPAEAPEQQAAVPRGAQPSERVSAEPAFTEPALQGIEALRFGIVPVRELARFTLGADELGLWGEGCLTEVERRGAGAFVVSGPYGTGKSHSLALVRQLALRRGFLVAGVELDGHGLSLSNPLMLLDAILSRVSGNGFPVEFPALALFELAASADTGDVAEARVLQAQEASWSNFQAIGRLAQAHALDELREHLEAFLRGVKAHTPVRLRKLASETAQIARAELVFHELLSGTVASKREGFASMLIAASCLARLAGYKGLIVILDEFEVEYSWAGGWKRTSAMVRALADALLAVPEGSDAALGLFFGAVPQGGSMGDSFLESTLRIPEGSCFRLRARTAEERLQLAAEVHGCYAQAYGLSSPFDASIAAQVEATLTQGVNACDDRQVRSFIQAYIGALDYGYGPKARTS